MDEENREKIGSAAGQFVQHAMELGLTWDEAVTAFGLAAKAAAQAAASTSENVKEDCIALARQRLDEAFAIDVRVVVTIDEAGHVGDDAQENPLLATAHRRQGSKLH